MLIAQISDLHVRATDGPGPLGVSINENLIAMVAQLNALDPRPDLVVATGDLTASGTPEQYARLAEILSELEIPPYLLPGNHDDPAGIAGLFHGTGTDRVAAIPLAGWDLLMLDSSVAGRSEGHLDAMQLDWLDARLTRTARRHALVVLHHPRLPA